MINFTLKEIDKKLGKQIIVEHHYTHKWSSCRYCLGLFDGDALLGVAVYGFPVGRQTVKSITPDLKNDEVLELTRFWVVDGTPKNTESYFLGKTFDWLRKNTKIKVLISYSDQCIITWASFIKQPIGCIKETTPC